MQYYSFRRWLRFYVVISFQKRNDERKLFGFETRVWSRRHTIRAFSTARTMPWNKVENANPLNEAANPPSAESEHPEFWLRSPLNIPADG